MNDEQFAILIEALRELGVNSNKKFDKIISLLEKIEK